MAGWQDVTELRAALRALSEDVRLNIMHQLAAQPETNVTDLVSALGVSQPLVSWHLRKLRRVGLVRTMRRGREVYCSLDTVRFAGCVRALSALVEPPPQPKGAALNAAALGTGSLSSAPEPASRAGARTLGKMRSRAGPAAT
jgi:ArsR family transcriptional regulator